MKSKEINILEKNVLCKLLNTKENNNARCKKKKAYLFSLHPSIHWNQEHLLCPSKLLEHIKTNTFRFKFF